MIEELLNLCSKYPFIVFPVLHLLIEQMIREVSRKKYPSPEERLVEGIRPVWGLQLCTLSLIFNVGIGITYKEIERASFLLNQYGLIPFLFSFVISIFFLLWVINLSQTIISFETKERCKLLREYSASKRYHLSDLETAKKKGIRLLATLLGSVCMACPVVILL